MYPILATLELTTLDLTTDFFFFFQVKNLRHTRLKLSENDNFSKSKRLTLGNCTSYASCNKAVKFTPLLRKDIILGARSSRSLIELCLHLPGSYTCGYKRNQFDLQLEKYLFTLPKVD